MSKRRDLFLRKTIICRTPISFNPLWLDHKFDPIEFRTKPIKSYLYFEPEHKGCSKEWNLRLLSIETYQQCCFEKCYQHYSLELQSRAKQWRNSLGKLPRRSQEHHWRKVYSSTWCRNHNEIDFSHVIVYYNKRRSTTLKSKTEINQTQYSSFWLDCKSHILCQQSEKEWNFKLMVNRHLPLSFFFPDSILVYFRFHYFHSSNLKDHRRKAASLETQS